MIMDQAHEQSTNLPRRPNATLLASIAFGHSVVHWFTQAFPVLLAEIVTSTGLSPLAADTIMGARNISGAIANIPVGMAADRYATHRTYFMTASLVWLGGGFFLIGIAPNQTWIMVFAVVLGVGSALWHPPAVGLLSTRFPARRASVMAIHGVGASVGDITGPLSVGTLLLVVSWESIFQASILPALVLAGAFFVTMRGVNTGNTRGQTSWADYFNALRQAARHRP